MSDAEAAIKWAEKQKALENQITVLIGNELRLRIEYERLRGDFDRLLEHLNLTFRDVPARRELTLLKGPEPTREEMSSWSRY